MLVSHICPTSGKKKKKHFPVIFGCHLLQWHKCVLRSIAFLSSWFTQLLYNQIKTILRNNQTQQWLWRVHFLVFFRRNFLPSLKIVCFITAIFCVPFISIDLFILTNAYIQHIVHLSLVYSFLAYFFLVKRDYVYSREICSCLLLFIF